MNKHILLFLLTCGLAPGIADAATCSRANLTRCLDSACAINVSSNPAARCQYCGTAFAGGIPASNGMRSVSVGTSAAITLSEKELKNAPSDPGARYAWATTECIKKVSSCTSDDVTETYDSLIEQSCRAAGITAQMATLRSQAAKTKTRSSCNTDIKSCIITEARCGADWRACSDDSDFDKFFSACSVDATGCDEYISSIRSELIATRNTTLQNADSVLDSIVTAYKNARAQKLATAKNDCRDNAARTACITTVCERSFPGKCGAGYESERAMATQLCKFHDIACDRLKI